MRTWALALAALLASASAWAGAPSEESINALLTATRAKSMLDSSMRTTEAMLTQAMANSLKGQTITPAQQKSLDTFGAKAKQALEEEMQWSKLRPDFVKVYQDTFTQEDVDALVAFYTSPAGVAYLEKMPALMQKTMAISQSRMAPLLERLKPLLAQTMAEIKTPPSPEK